MSGPEAARGIPAKGVGLGGNFIFAGEREVLVMRDDMWTDVWVGEGLVRRA